MECRVCMDTSGDGFTEMSYAVDADGNTLFDYFNECTQLQATSFDYLPKTVCTNCIKDLQISFNLKQRARQSDIELKKLYTSQDVKLERIHSPNVLLENVEESSNDPLATLEFNEKQPFVNTNTSESGMGLAVGVVKIENQIESTREEKCQIQIVNEYVDESMVDDAAIGNTQFKKKKKFCCEFCECVYKTNRALKKHIFEAHKSEVICMKCAKVYDIPKDLQMHETLVHSTESPIQCPFCDKRKVISRDRIRQHFKMKHKNLYLKFFPRSQTMQSYECGDCHQDFDSVLELADHIKNHTFGCPICFTNFAKRGTFRAHIKRIHNSSTDSTKPILGGIVEMKKPYKCSSCSEKFSFERSLQAHRLKEHNQDDNSDDEKEYRYECKICELRFKRRINYQKHNNQKHADQYIANAPSSNCSTSTKHSDNDTDYEEGEKLRKEKQTYICSFCPTQLSSVRSLQTHELRTHSTDNTLRQECPICKKKFYSTYIKYHMKTVHAKERKSVCDICGDSFKNYSQLRAHKTLHRKRNFECNVCEKTFISNCSLNVHMRSHTGEMPYECHLCDRRFKIKGALNYHLQQHAGIKRKCQECGKEFNHVAQLKKHMYKHIGMPFRCSICDYGTARRAYFKTHLSRLHNMTMSDDELSAMFKEHTGRNPHVKMAEDMELENEMLDEENGSS